MAFVSNIILCKEIYIIRGKVALLTKVLREHEKQTMRQEKVSQTMWIRKESVRVGINRLWDTK